jgi:hypothetical protein
MHHNQPQPLHCGKRTCSPAVRHQRSCARVRGIFPDRMDQVSGTGVRTKEINRRHRLITVFGMVLPKLSCLIRLLGSPCNRDTETVSRLIDVEPPRKDPQQGINIHLRDFDNNKLAAPTLNTPRTHPQELLHNLRLLDAVPLQPPIPFLKLDSPNQFAPNRMHSSMQTPIHALTRVRQQPDRTCTRLCYKTYNANP